MVREHGIDERIRIQHFLQVRTEEHRPLRVVHDRGRQVQNVVQALVTAGRDE